MIQIRPMQIEDIEQVSSIENELFSVPWSSSDLEYAVRNQSDYYLVAVSGETIVGYCGLRQVLDEGNINNVAVAKQYQQKGIAYAMLGELIQGGRKNGINAFTLEVRAGNQKARQLYLKLGFKEEGIRKKYYQKPVEDAVIMWLYF